MRITSYHLLNKWLHEINHPNKDDYSFIEKAERWNYKNFGIGYCSLTKFLDFLNSKRLERRDVKYLSTLRNQIYLRDNYTCKYCKIAGGILEIDHVIPYSKGGSNEIENLVTACRKCNRQKKDKSVEEFIIWKKNKL